MRVDSTAAICNYKILWTNHNKQIKKHEIKDKSDMHP